MADVKVEGIEGALTSTSEEFLSKKLETNCGKTCFVTSFFKLINFMIFAWCGLLRESNILATFIKVEKSTASN